MYFINFLRFQVAYLYTTLAVYIGSENLKFQTNLKTFIDLYFIFMHINGKIHQF